MVREIRNRSILSLLFCLLTLLAMQACGGDSDSTPGAPDPQGSGDLTVLIQELDGLGPGAAVLSSQTIRTTRATVGISETSKEGSPATMVAQDMTIGIQFPLGGFLQLQAINYRERFDKGVPITDIEVFTAQGSDDGETPIARFTYFETTADIALQDSFNAPAETGSTTSYLTVDDVTAAGLFGSFDATFEGKAGRFVRIASVNAAGSPAGFFAGMSDEPAQAFAPVAILQSSNFVQGNPCTIDLDVGLSVDPNGDIVEWGIDIGDPPDGIVDFPQTSRPWYTFTDGDPPSNTTLQFQIQSPSSGFLQAVVLDEEGNTSGSTGVLFDCQ